MPGFDCKPFQEQLLLGLGCPFAVADGLMSEKIRPQTRPLERNQRLTTRHPEMTGLTVLPQ